MPRIAYDPFNDARPSRDGRMRANCPFCPQRVGKEDHRRSLRVWAGSGWYSCFRCGVKGYADGRQMQEFGAKEARRSNETPGPPPGFYELATHLGADSLRAAEAHVLGPRPGGRGLPLDVVREAHVGACVFGRYADRVVVPIFGDEGAWVGFAARDLTGRSAVKYLCPSWMERDGMMYREAVFFDEKKADELAFAVEGTFDALALDPDAGAFVGSPAPSQIELLGRSKRPVAVIMDGDAHEKGWAIAMELRAEGARAGSVRLPPMVDPDEVPRDLLEKAGRAAVESPGAEAVL